MFEIGDVTRGEHATASMWDRSNLSAGFLDRTPIARRPAAIRKYAIAASL
jgi:hypothetical protein